MGRSRGDKLVRGYGSPERRQLLLLLFSLGDPCSGMAEPELVISAVHTEALSERRFPLFFCFNKASVTVLPLPLNGKAVHAESAYPPIPDFDLASERAGKE